MATVLVIDDEPSDRALLDMKLGRQGYDVFIAHNGWKGLQLYRQGRPDVVVLDLKMPELDGVTVLKEIRRVDPKQPVIIWAGDIPPETGRQVQCTWSERGHRKRFLDTTPGGHTQVPSQASPSNDGRLDRPVPIFLGHPSHKRHSTLNGSLQIVA